MASKAKKIKLVEDVDTGELIYLQAGKPIDPNTIGISFQDIEDLLWGEKEVTEDETGRSVDWPESDIFAGTCLEDEVDDADRNKFMLKALEKARKIA